MSDESRVRVTHTDLESAILRERPSLSGSELARSAEISTEQAKRLWRALGFPEHADDVVAYLPSDAQAISTLLGVMAGGVLDDDLAVNMTRALGQTMARLAEWEVTALVQRVEQLHETGAAGAEGGEGGVPGSRVGSALQLVEELSEPFEELLIYAWRRHLAAAAARIEALAADDEDLHTVELTVGFADIVGFTALSNTLTEERIGDLVELFEMRCADVVAAQRGRDHQRHRSRPADARRARRPGQRLGGAAARRRLRPAGQHGRAADQRRAAQPDHHRRGDLAAAARGPVRDPPDGGAAGARLRHRRARRRTPALRPALTRHCGRPGARVCYRSVHLEGLCGAPCPLPAAPSGGKGSSAWRLS